VADASTDRPMSVIAALSWTVALFVLQSLIVGVTQLARPGADTDVVNLSACVVLATSIAIFGTVRLYASDASLRAALGVRRISPLHFSLSIAAGAGLYPLLTTLNDLVVNRWPYEDAETIESLQKLVATSSRMTLVLGGYVIIPLARELWFRGILFGQLRRTTSSLVATLSTAAAFAGAPLDWRTMPTAFVLGVAFARLRERSGSVLGAIVAHLAFCSVEGVPILRGRDLAADVTYSTRWIVGGAVIAIVALVAVGVGRGVDE
jgi:membrane protease YdiL (CAAX protease family)